MFILNIKDLYDSVKSTVENTYTFVIVRGYVASYNTDNNGNLYLTLQDILEHDTVTIQCCCWNSRKSKIKTNITKENIFNKEVIIKGYISVYKKPVSIKLIVFDITLDEKSNFQALNYKKEQLLREQGYFNEEKKKNLPRWPNIIGLITSKNGEAYTDFITSLKQRFPATILFYNTATQGNNSALEIIEAINYFNNLSIGSQPKVIVITRGGGSFEDLQTFNEESLVKAIYKSTIPIITAIGHTNDITFADYTADKYSSTPTKAAEMITPIPLITYKNNLKNTIHLLLKIPLEKFNHYKTQLELLNLKISDDLTILNNMQYRVNELNKISNIIIKDCYFNYSNILKDIKNQLEYLLINVIKDKTKFFVILHQNFINKINYYIKNQKNNFILLKNIFISIPFNIQGYHNQLYFIKTTLKNQCTILFKAKLNNYHYLSKVLSTLSYESTLKRGYTIIKDYNSENIITRSTNLENKLDFDIVFYDKTITISKK